jgi:hypothetical protein
MSDPRVTVPNANSPLALSGGNIAFPWLRFFTDLYNRSLPSGGAIPFKGTAAPNGFTQVSGLPSLPAGWIWIQKN